MTDSLREHGFETIYFTARDGLRLHGRRYPARRSGRSPVLCLPGLTRNSKDFHRLALYLSDLGDGARDVYTIDYRGRGRSDWSHDWKDYNIHAECLDVLDFMTLRGLEHAHVVGTSRGGMIAMVMGLLRPAALLSVTLNDIGPVIERDGLMRIIGYVGRVPLPADWADAQKLVRDINRAQFPAVSDEEWMEVAHAWFNDEDGLPTQSYDPALANAISMTNFDEGIPTLWPQFDSLAKVPMLAIRGESSDILSPATHSEMAERHPGMESLVVPQQGHAPLLTDEPTLATIAAFMDTADASRATVPGRQPTPASPVT
ncbi:MAG: alpha/beta hydrolase [Hyphomicrobiaceae bacterium]